MADVNTRAIERKLDRIRTASARDGVTHTDKIGKGRLKDLDLTAEDIAAAFQDTAYGGVNGSPLREIGSAGICLGDLDR